MKLFILLKYKIFWMDKPMELLMKHLAKLNFQYGQITISSMFLNQTKAKSNGHFKNLCDRKK